jgi:small subunit ribosomal protein S4e
MANKGGSGYIKRLYAPKYFAIHRKEHKYVVKQNPGRHSLKKSVALSLIIGKLMPDSTRLEAERIIKGKDVSVNGKTVREPKFPVGLNDSIVIGADSYIIGINERGQISVNKNDKASKLQLYKIVGKYKSKANQLMLRLHDGSAVKGTAEVNVNDSVAVSQGKISKVVKLDKGSKCEVIDGVHVGVFGTIKEIGKGGMHKEKSVTVEPQKGEAFETLVRNIIVVE